MCMLVYNLELHKLNYSHFNSVWSGGNDLLSFNTKQLNKITEEEETDWFIE